MSARPSVYCSWHATERPLPPTRFGNPQYTCRCSVRCPKENVKYRIYRLPGFISFVSCNTRVSTQELKTEKVIFPLCSGNDLGRERVVNTATRYGVGGPEIESRCAGEISRPSVRALESTQPPVQWVPGLFPFGKAAGV
jgi:hypothetical protein